MASDLVSRKNFMLLGLSAAAAGVLEVACSSPDAGPPDGSGGSSGGSASKGGSTGSGGASSGGASSGGASSGGTSGGASSGGTGQGGATTGGSGGTPGGSGGSGGAGAMCLAVAVEISCNHEADADPHMLTVPLEDVMAGTDKPYTLVGNATHDHEIMLTAAHFTTLRNGGTVHIYAESDFQSHCVTITCGVASVPTTAECAEDSMVCG